MRSDISARLGAIAVLPLLALAVASCQAPGTRTQSTHDPTEPWNWSDDVVRAEVNHVRAGRDLNPVSWPDGARVAVLLSYDVDNETVYGLRTGEVSVGPLSQGQYGSRVALPRIVNLMDQENVPATFFFPAWSLKLAPELVKHYNILLDAGLSDLLLRPGKLKPEEMRQLAQKIQRWSL